MHHFFQKGATIIHSYSSVNSSNFPISLSATHRNKNAPLIHKNEDINDRITCSVVSKWKEVKSGPTPPLPPTPPTPQKTHSEAKATDRQMMRCCPRQPHLSVPPRHTRPTIAEAPLPRLQRRVACCAICYTTYKELA